VIYPVERSILRSTSSGQSGFNTLSQPLDLDVLNGVQEPGDSSLSIASLPLEVLCRIILEATFHIPLWGGPASSWIPEFSDPRRAVVLSHVCKDWRAACVGFPALWSTPVVSLASHELDGEMLGRAADSPLSIVLWRQKTGIGRFVPATEIADGSDPAMPPFLSSLLKGNMHRIRDFFYKGDELPMDVLEMDAPMLETVCIDATAMKGVEPVVSLSMRAPKLRLLALPSVGTPFRAPVLSNAHLTHLAIHGDWWETEPQTVINWLDTLSQAPNLTHLEIDFPRWRNSWDWWIAEGRPPLRERLGFIPLTTITLIGELVVSVAVLQHLQLPTDVELNLQTPDGGSADTPEVACLCSFIAPHMTAQGHLPFSAQFSREEWHDTLFRLELVGSHERVIIYLGDNEFDPYSKEAFNQHVGTLLASAGWDRLEELAVDMPAGSSPDLARWIMQMLKNSSTLRIIRCTGSVVLAALLEALLDPAATTSVHECITVRFPALKTLVLTHIGMHNPCIQLSLGVSGRPTNLKELTTVLTRRALLGTSLNMLMLEHCGLGLEDAEVIRTDLRLSCGVKEVTILCSTKQ
jgi:hypothetical protein